VVATQSTKSQIPNSKLISPGTTALNHVSVIEYWNLGFIWDLVLGIWDFLL
jgi:hypothetical protein